MTFFNVYVAVVITHNILNWGVSKVFSQQCFFFLRPWYSFSAAFVRVLTLSAWNRLCWQNCLCSPKALLPCHFNFMTRSKGVNVLFNSVDLQSCQMSPAFFARQILVVRFQIVQACTVHWWGCRCSFFFILGGVWWEVGSAEGDHSWWPSGVQPTRMIKTKTTKFSLLFSTNSRHTSFTFSYICIYLILSYLGIVLLLNMYVCIYILL